MINNKSYITILGVSILLYAYFLFLYPSSINHDDSFFFIKGIENFSVIEFSPHFPGYPTFMIVLKFLNIFINDAQKTLSFVNVLSTLSCILLASLIVKKYTNSIYSLLTCFSLIFSSMLLYSSQLLISDSFGLALFLLAFFLLQKENKKTAGIVLAFALWARPSYLVLVLALLIYKKNKDFFVYFFITSFLVLCLLLFVEGSSYINEAIRFIEGHFSIWGKGQFSKDFVTITWADILLEKIGLVKLLLLGVSILLLFFRKNLLAFIFISYTFWIIFAQNPNSIRHLIPLFVLGHMIFFIFIATLKNRVFTILLILSFFASSNIYKEKFLFEESPLIKASKLLPKDSILISNYGIQTLRSLGFTVLDKYYFQAVKSYLRVNKDKEFYILSMQNKTLFEGFELYKIVPKNKYYGKDIYLYRKIIF